jgi:hypothetical protein
LLIFAKSGERKRPCCRKLNTGLAENDVAASIVFLVSAIGRASAKPNEAVFS